MFNMVSVLNADSASVTRSDAAVAVDIQGLNFGPWMLDCARRNADAQWVCKVSFFMMLPACGFLAIASIGALLGVLRLRSMRSVLTAPRCHIWSVMHVWARENYRLSYADGAHLGWWHHILVIARLRSPFQVLKRFGLSISAYSTSLSPASITSNTKSWTP
jgi:hypothetical protein